ncbi:MULTISPECIES: hypothetical protein [unclassified Candidatus Frackibacter]|uniref:hypothetical protein n=1 Tax=unclassified Candidatus Frackibacter TaxID=2648818 RepID=UPI0007922AFB|nr:MULTISPECIES: hypothetical protein [unclassified Candidatus Frackibacter]KXS42982.1 MAG: hypothetical protein AWU54_1162 [Candidatus Frackibacter sp. T328-2]SDB96173.1 hypothetical protein SAMN04515661_1013 [Candidatus Frackibacter sp. WG11]SEM27572.1 hypothetical protein SAMN04488698_1014 [Candidatus Frackibacter sp. WG12]SFL32362.1 hypothetical protein SAMN04488699_1014 [Candidatus Frackibacter sp. WG13]
MSFNPKKHLTKVKGKDYLEVKWRLVWFREEHPHYGIDTEFLILDMDQGIAVCQATISNEEGQDLAKGTKTEYKASFFDFVEKAETGAIGRALAALGYGTQFAPELEEGERIVDSPVNLKNDERQDNYKDKSKQDIINDINDTIEKEDFSHEEAKKILTDNLNKKSLKDCSKKELVEYLEILRKERCQSCKAKISEAVVKYCEKNKDKFDGQCLCINCQDDYK